MEQCSLIPEDATHNNKNAADPKQEDDSISQPTTISNVKLSLDASDDEPLVNDKDDLVFEMTNFGMIIEVFVWGRKDREIEILKNINAIVMGGEILAIMGPSGAGKTSVLECATRNQPPNAKITGTVTINDLTLTKKMFQEHCYIVQQKDFLSATLSCKETLMFTAKNCIIDENQIAEKVDELLKCLGLDECENVRVGNDFIPGLSGGQKRRLSVGLALVKMPKFLFLDEPTSGLDSASAFKTCHLLKKIVLQFNMATVLTIHQPNTKIYDTFSKLMLLHKGEVVYFGPANAADVWLAEMGLPLPPKTNIADYLIDILEDEEFHNLKKAFDMKKLTKRLSRKDRISLVKPEGEILVKLESLESRKLPSLGRQIVSTLYKEGLIIKRDPMLYTGRCVVFIVIGIFFALVYIKSRHRDQDQVLSRIWLVVWMCACPTSMAAAQVFIHSMDIIDLKRNVRNGIQQPIPFIFAKLLQLPMMLIFSLCCFTVGAY